MKVAALSAVPAPEWLAILLDPPRRKLQLGERSTGWMRRGALTTRERGEAQGSGAGGALEDARARRRGRGGRRALCRGRWQLSRAGRSPCGET